MPNEIIPGFYGKVPAIGDFVMRRLPPDIVKHWDAWLQKAVKAGQDQLGTRFRKCYTAAPIWRFVFGPGVCGKSGMAGILAPSFDKVGRAFPLTLAIAAEGSLTHLMLRAAQWFSQLEILVELLMKKKIDIKRFDLQLQQQKLPPALFKNREQIKANVVSSANDTLFFQMQMNSLHQTPEAFEDLTALLLDRHLTHYSLWWAKGTAMRKPTFQVFKGLPSPELYPQFLAEPSASADG